MTEKRFKVVVMDDYEQFAQGVPAFEKLAKVAEVTVSNRKLETDDELACALQGADAVVLMRERSRFGERELELSPSLRFISQIGRGIPHLNVPAATKRGIPVSATPADSGISTIELTFAMMLSLSRQIPAVNAGMHAGDWPPLVGRLLNRKTLGIVGLGRIGTQVARIAQAFGMRVLAAGKTLTDQRAERAGCVRVSLERLLQEADVVSLHCKLSDETRGLIGERELSLMKTGAFLINTARGPIVSEAALMKFLENGHLGGAGLDVFDLEPLPSDHPLRRLDRTILTSHRGYGVDEILHERYEGAFANILAFIEGKPENLLNPEVLKR